MNEKVTKDVCFGMMLNLLCQIRDVCDSDDESKAVMEVTTNPDMERFDDFSIDDVIKIAQGYDCEIDGDEVDKIESELRKIEGNLETIGRRICSKNGSVRSLHAISEAVDNVGEAIHSAYLMRD